MPILLILVLSFLIDISFEKVTANPLNHTIMLLTSFYTTIIFVLSFALAQGPPPYKLTCFIEQVTLNDGGGTCGYGILKTCGPGDTKDSCRRVQSCAVRTPCYNTTTSASCCTFGCVVLEKFIKYSLTSRNSATNEACTNCKSS